MSASDIAEYNEENHGSNKIAGPVLQVAVRQLFTLLPLLFLVLAAALTFDISSTFALTALFITGTGSTLYYLTRNSYAQLLGIFFIAAGGLFSINRFYFSGESVLSLEWLPVFFREISVNLFSLFNPELIAEGSSLSTGACLVMLTAVLGWFIFYQRFARGRGMLYLFLGSLLFFIMLLFGNPVGLLLVLFLISMVAGLPLESAPPEKLDRFAVRERTGEKFWNIRIGFALMAIIVLLAVAALFYLAWSPPASQWLPSLIHAADRGITVFIANDLAAQHHTGTSGVQFWIAGEIILLVLLMVTVMSYRNRIRPVHLVIVLVLAFGVFIMRGVYSTEYLAALPQNLLLIILRTAVFMFLIAFFFVWRPNLVPLAILFFFFLPVLVSPGTPDRSAFSGLEDFWERVSEDETFEEFFERDPDLDGDAGDAAEDETAGVIADGTDDEAADADDETAPDGFLVPDSDDDDAGSYADDAIVMADPENGDFEDETYAVDQGFLEGLVESIFGGDDEADDEDVSGAFDETVLDEVGDEELPLEQRNGEIIDNDDMQYAPETAPPDDPGRGEDGLAGEETEEPGFIVSFLTEHSGRIILIIFLLAGAAAAWFYHPEILRSFKKAGPLLKALPGYMRQFFKDLIPQLYDALPASLKDHLETMNADPERKEYYIQLRAFSRQYPRKASETPREYYNRLLMISGKKEKTLDKARMEEFRRLTLDFEKVRYRGVIK